MASIIPDYEYDIFISYRQKDNRSEHWVTNFVQALREELDATFKEEVSSYFDSNPHDGLLETHDVDASLKGKIKCLIFIPVVSQTYCDPKSFAWQKEFLAFIDFAKADEFGLDIKLSNGNVAKRVLPVRIHEIDEVDKKLFEDAVGGILRPVDFIFKSSGVNRPLRSNEDHPQDNVNKTYYRDQINKVANAIKEIIISIKTDTRSEPIRPKNTSQPTTNNIPRSKILIATTAMVIVIVGFFYYKNSTSIPIDAAQASIAVIPFLNNTGDSNIEWYGLGIANEIRTQLSVSKQFDFISSMQATMEFKNSTEPPNAIGEKLGVTHILSGVYQQINNEIKVIVELVDSSTGKIIWSLPYNTTLADVGNLQASIAKEVIRKFQGSTTSVKTVRVNMKAFSEVSRGDEVMYRSQTNFLKAADHYKNAIKIDSTFFPAWAGLIRTLANYSFVIDRKDSTIKKELKSHLDYVSAHFEDSWERTEIFANYKYHVEGKFEEARELFLKVLEENPNAETANYLLGGIYKRTLKLPQAFKYLQKAIKLRNTPLHMQDWGNLFHLNGEYEKEEAAMLNAASRGANAAWGAIYDLKYLKNDLSHLPSEAKQLYSRQIKYDSLELSRDFKGLLDEWKKTKVDSVFNQDRLIAEKLLCFYQLHQDDSVSFYAKQWHSADQVLLVYRNAFLGQESRIDEVFSTMNFSKEDLTQQTFTQEVNIRLAVFARKYPRATQLLKELNKKYPGYGNYLFLNNPMYDRIKKEYPPFNDAIRNLKLPLKLSDSEIVKM